MKEGKGAEGRERSESRRRKRGQTSVAATYEGRPEVGVRRVRERGDGRSARRRGGARGERRGWGRGEAPRVGGVRVKDFPESTLSC